MKTLKYIFTLLIIWMAFPSNIYAYGNVYAHPQMNSSIVDQFKSRLPNYVKNYPLFAKFKNYYFGLDISSIKGIAVTKPGNWSINEEEQTKTAKDWIMHGGYSADEPEIPASLRHFYDPVMNERVLYLTNTGINPPFSNPCIDAVYWAFNGAEIGSSNQWTWNKGKDFMVLALEETDEAKKSLYLGKALRCLGEVLHNTADMGLPAHVRNDAHGGWWYFAGGNDPYESTYKPSWAYEFGTAVCDPDLATYFRNAKKAEDINKYLGKFTNKYFFSHETISGTGVEEYSSANGFKNYDAPKLQDFEYRPESFGYYKKFPSGREVKMCVDQSLFMGYISANFRSTPRVDFSCVESQATELVPDIIEAGINVIRNFIPEFEVSISVNPQNGDVSGYINHTTDNEYTSSIGYSGKVDLWINGKLSPLSATAKDGKITGKITHIANGDKVVAKISFADIVVSSPEFKIDTKSLSLLNMEDIIVRADFVWGASAKWGGYVRDQFSDWKLTTSNSTITATSCTLNKTTSFAPHSVSEFSITFNPATQKVEKFNIVASSTVSGFGKIVYKISMNEPAPVATKWFTSGGCDLMTLSFDQLKKYVSYAEERYNWQKISDKPELYDYVYDRTVTLNDLVAGDGFGHATSIRFYTNATK